MVSWRSVQNMLPKGSSCTGNPNPPSTIEESIREAAENQLAKESKLTVAIDAVMLDDLDELAAEDREVTRRYRDKILANKLSPRQSNGDGSQEDEMGDRSIIVCDDYHVNETPSQAPPSESLPVETVETSWASKALGPLALAFGLVGAGSLGMVAERLLSDKPDVPPLEAPVSNGDADTHYNLEFVEGE